MLRISTEHSPKLLTKGRQRGDTKSDHTRMYTDFAYTQYIIPLSKNQPHICKKISKINRFQNSTRKETKNLEQRTLHFSVDGAFITQFAREKLYYSNDLYGAVQLLLSCLVSDDLTEYARLGIAVKILDGKMKIVGT